MATNNKYKRDATRAIRDGIKSNYRKDPECKICGTVEDLELHHYHTVSLLVENFARANRLDFNNEEVVLANRTAFYEQYWHELVEDTVTLCADHHQKLHKVYTKKPPLFTVEKQKNWVEIQRTKYINRGEDKELPPINSHCIEPSGATATKSSNRFDAETTKNTNFLDFRVETRTRFLI